MNGLKKLIKDVKDKLKKDLLVTWGDRSDVSFIPKVVSTGSVGLDWALGGGIALGRITEIFSNKEGEGKSSICLSIVKKVQENGGIPVLIDTEQGNVLEHLKEFGIDENNLIFGTPDTIEEVFDLIKTLVESWEEPNTGIIIWDSITATPSQEQMDAEFGDRLYSPQARIVSQSLPKIVKNISDKNIGLVITNQTRAKIGNIVGEGLDTTCGKALKFYASQRIKLSAKEVRYHGMHPVGLVLKATIVKNKIARPFRTVQMYLDFSKGFDVAEDYFELGKMIGYFKEGGGWVEVKGVEKKMRRQDVLDMLNTDNVLQEEIWKGVTAL